MSSRRAWTAPFNRLACRCIQGESGCLKKGVSVRSDAMMKNHRSTTSHNDTTHSTLGTNDSRISRCGIWTESHRSRPPRYPVQPWYPPWVSDSVRESRGTCHTATPKHVPFWSANQYGVRSTEHRTTELPRYLLIAGFASFGFTAGVIPLLHLLGKARRRRYLDQRNLLTSSKVALEREPQLLFYHHTPSPSFNPVSAGRLEMRDVLDEIEKSFPEQMWSDQRASTVQ